MIKASKKYKVKRERSEAMNSVRVYRISNQFGPSLPRLLEILRVRSSQALVGSLTLFAMVGVDWDKNMYHNIHAFINHLFIVMNKIMEIIVKVNSFT